MDKPRFPINSKVVVITPRSHHYKLSGSVANRYFEHLPAEWVYTVYIETDGTMGAWQFRECELEFDIVQEIVRKYEEKHPNKNT
jgi:hypothetical protein